MRIMRLDRPATPLLLALPLIAALAAPIEGRTPPAAPVQVISATGTVDTRNGEVRIESGTTFTGSLSAQNGRISVGSDARVLDLSTRNGRIDVGPRSLVDGAIETRNGRITVADGVTVIGPVDSRNGAIEFGADVEVRGPIDSRNGRVVVGRMGRVESAIRTRNGGVTVESGGSVGADIETRNGEIRLHSGAAVDGNVHARNGSVRLADARVGGNVEVQGGDVDLSGRTEVRGDVILLMSEDRGRGFWFWPFNRWEGGDPPVIRIGSEARVDGRLIVDERARLEIAPGADVPEPEFYPNLEAWPGR
jgi:cytoskeletal protein CcmA (bactofilin family)